MTEVEELEGQLVKLWQGWVGRLSQDQLPDAQAAMSSFISNHIQHSGEPNPFKKYFVDIVDVDFEPGSES